MSAVFPGDVNTLDQGHTLFKNFVLEDFPKSCDISICGILRVFHIYQGFFNAAYTGGWSSAKVHSFPR